MLGRKQQSSTVGAMRLGTEWEPGVATEVVAAAASAPVQSGAAAPAAACQAALPLVEEEVETRRERAVQAPGKSQTPAPASGGRERSARCQAHLRSVSNSQLACGLPSGGVRTTEGRVKSPLSIVVDGSLSGGGGAWRARAGMLARCCSDWSEGGRASAGAGGVDGPAVKGCGEGGSGVDVWWVARTRAAAPAAASAVLSYADEWINDGDFDTLRCPRSSFVICSMLCGQVSPVLSPGCGA